MDYETNNVYSNKQYSPYNQVCFRCAYDTFILFGDTKRRNSMEIRDKHNNI